MAKKEQTNGGSNKISIVGGNMYVNKDKELDIPPKSAIRYEIATLEKLQETGYLEINVGHHEVVKEGEKVVQRISENGKVLTGKSKKSKNKEVETR